MKFRMLLWALGLLMKKASKNSEGFQQSIQGKTFTFQLGTEKGDIVRHYIVANGRVKSKSGHAKDKAFSIAFVDAETAIDVMTSKDRNAVMRGIQDKTIQIDGDLTLIMWFQGINKYLKSK